MLQLKISRMKKRLSEDNWNHRKIYIALMGLVVILSFMLKVISISEKYGVVDLEIPILSNPIDDPSSKTFKEEPQVALSKTTPLILLTDTAYIFGDVESFSSRYLNVRNKFSIPHVSGSPNLDGLTLNLKKWIFSRMSEKDINHHGIVVLAPAENIPMPIVIHTVATIKKLKIFNRVVLASGIL